MYHTAHQAQRTAERSSTGTQQTDATGSPNTQCLSRSKIIEPQQRADASGRPSHAGCALRVDQTRKTELALLLLYSSSHCFSARSPKTDNARRRIGQFAEKPAIHHRADFPRHISLPPPSTYTHMSATKDRLQRSGSTHHGVLELCRVVTAPRVLGQGNSQRSHGHETDELTRRGALV